MRHPATLWTNITSTPTAVYLQGFLQYSTNFSPTYQLSLDDKSVDNTAIHRLTHCLILRISPITQSVPSEAKKKFETESEIIFAIGYKKVSRRANSSNFLEAFHSHSSSNCKGSSDLLIGSSSRGSATLEQLVNENKLSVLDSIFLGLYSDVSFLASIAPRSSRNPRLYRHRYQCACSSRRNPSASCQAGFCLSHDLCRWCDIGEGRMSDASMSGYYTYNKYPPNTSSWRGINQLYTC